MIPGAKPMISKCIFRMRELKSKFSIQFYKVNRF